MRVLHFDTETTGIPVSGAPSDDPRHPKIVSISAMLDDAEGNELIRMNHIIRPEGWTIDEAGEAFAVHKITQERALAEGIPLADSMALFKDFSEEADVFSAFNFFFDWKLLKIACAQAGEQGEAMRQYFETKSSICTMEGAALTLIGKKRIKLVEAYRQLVGTDYVGAHDSMADTQASRAVFYKLKERGALPTPKPMARPVYATPLEAA